MVDSFFVNPSKRKRATSSTRKRTGQARAASAGGATANGGGRAKRRARDEEITSDSDAAGIDSDSDASVASDMSVDSEEEFEGETEADKRRRLAKQYLENVQEELQDSMAFDAKDLDREIISRRLKEDVADKEGKVYRFIADQLQIKGCAVKSARSRANGLTAVAARYPYAFTVSKDLFLTKWDISNLSGPKPVRFVRGNRRKKSESYQGHYDEILCVAVSPNGQWVATGGRDKRIIIWSAETLAPVKVFETRDRKGVVTGLVFRRNTNELYASCADLKVRTYNIDQLAQVETLFGHQDVVVDIAALGQERCVSVGARDRTAMLWKINEETRLTFRGGDSKLVPGRVFEGSIDCCTMIDDQLFVTGSDNGSISLWSVSKKKPLHVLREAHGRDPPMTPQQASAETDPARAEIPDPQPRYITCVYAVPYSDVFFTGSWSGDIKAWKLTEDKRSFVELGSIPGIEGIVNRIAVVETGSRNKEVFAVVAAVSKELRLGRWMRVKGKNSLVSAIIPRRA